MKENKNPSDIVLKLSVDCETYWDIYSLVEKGIFLNIIMGGRGIGKTEQCNGYNLEQYRDYGNQFIYLRRYKPECSNQKKLLDRWLDDVKFVGDKNGGGSYMWYGNTLGYLIPLSVASNYKSTNFEKVTTIIYDEAIIRPTGQLRYMPNEVECLLEFISTVFRHRTNGKVIILGNNLCFFNPYCEYFNVKVFNDYYIDKKRGILIQYSKDSPKLRQIEEKTPLFKLTMGTTYHDYHYNNAVLTDKKINTVKKYNNDKLHLRILLNEYTLNVYTRSTGKLLLESKRKRINDSFSLSIINNSECNFPNMSLFRQRWYDFICFRYYNDNVEFVDEDSYALLQELLNMF